MNKRLDFRFLGLAILCLGLVLASCGGDSPSGPGGGGGIPIYFSPTAFNGTFSLNFQGKTYTAPTTQTVQLSPGTYEMSGTATIPAFIGSQFCVGFTGNGPGLGKGGVQSNSLVSVEGPVGGGFPLSCVICYSVYDNSTTQTFSFRFRFTVTSDQTKAC